MENQILFFYRTYKDSYSFSNSQPDLIKWSKNHHIEVDENVEFKQYISVSVFKYKDVHIEKPTSTKFEKVRPILKELFEDYYLLALKHIKNVNIEDGEFYLTKHSKGYFEIEYFSLDEKNKKHINIDFRDFIEDLWMTFSCSNSFVNRRGARKNGAPITKEVFLQFLNLTVKYFSDHNSLNTYLDSYIKSFFNLVNDDMTIEGFDFSSESIINNILKNIQARIEYIEKNLIEEDDIFKDERIKLRGELEGLRYAKQVVNTKK